MKVRNTWSRKRKPNLPNPKKLDEFPRKFLNRGGMSIREKYRSLKDLYALSEHLLNRIQYYHDIVAMFAIKEVF
jgi:hypothetical protein